MPRHRTAPGLQTLPNGPPPAPAFPPAERTERTKRTAAAAARTPLARRNIPEYLGTPRNTPKHPGTFTPGHPWPAGDGRDASPTAHKRNGNRLFKHKTDADYEYIENFSYF